MKIAMRCLLVMVFINAVVCPVFAGVIPSSLIQSEEEIAKVKICGSLKHRQAEILKKMSELKREQERYQAELAKLGKNDCAEPQQ